MKFQEVLAQIMSQPTTRRLHYQGMFRTNLWRLRYYRTVANRAGTATGVTITFITEPTQQGNRWQRIWNRDILFTIAGTGGELQQYFRLAQRIHDGN